MKYPRGKLTKSQRDELLIRFADAFTSLKTLEEAADFIQDLLTKQEAEMLAKRLAIADLLIDGYRYQDIQLGLKVATSTIARVNLWLESSGSGFRRAQARKRPIKRPPRRRKHFSVHRWPLQLIGELFHEADRAQRERLIRMFHQLDDKSDLYRELQPYLVLLNQPKPKSSLNSNIPSTAKIKEQEDPGQP